MEGKLKHKNATHCLCFFNHFLKAPLNNFHVCSVRDFSLGEAGDLRDNALQLMNKGAKSSTTDKRAALVVSAKIDDWILKSSTFMLKVKRESLKN